jgi:hypothetical protein
MDRRKFILNWLNIMGTRHSPILMSANRRGSFPWGEKVLKIRDAGEDRQMSKFISETREHSKHRPMLQFEILVRPLALFRQPHSMSSLKFFIWNFVPADRSPTK